MIAINPSQWLVMTVFGACFGACVGSFLNVCIYRIPLDQSVISPRSHCMRCGKVIPWYRNLPVASYFILKGKCADCGAEFSFRYAVVELLTAGLFVVPCLQYPPLGLSPALGLVPLASAWMIPVVWLFLGGLIIATFVDLDHFIIPDSVTWGGMVAGLALSALLPELHGQSIWWRGLMMSGLGLAVGFGLLELVAVLGKLALKKDAMGFGDVKLMGAIGAFFGWQAAIFCLIGAAFAGAFVGLVLIALRRGKIGAPIPFGPYIALAGAVWVFWGPKLMALYLSMFQGGTPQ